MSYSKISTLNMPREEWLALRRRGIGGSDASAVVGLNPFSSRLAVYADKTGMLPEREDTEAMRQGRDLEAYVAQRWEEATGKRVRRENHLLISNEYPWAFANLDRVVVGEKAFLEVKTTSVYNNTPLELGNIPDNYYVQCMHYMAVTGLERAYLAVMVLNQAFYTFTIERNEDEIKVLMEAERAFWYDHVVAGVPPAGDGSDSAQRVLELQERDDDTALLLDMEDTFAEMEYLKQQADSYTTKRDALKQQILQRMDRCNRGKALTWKCSFLPTSRVTIDAKKLNATFPEAYALCAKETTSTTFRVTKMKEDQQ